MIKTEVKQGEEGEIRKDKVDRSEAGEEGRSEAGGGRRKRSRGCGRKTERRMALWKTEN